MGKVAIRPEVVDALNTATDDELIAYVSETFGIDDKLLYRMLQIEKGQRNQISLHPEHDRLISGRTEPRDYASLSALDVRVRRSGCAVGSSTVDRPLLNPDLINNQYGLSMSNLTRFWEGVRHLENGCAVYKDRVFRVQRSAVAEEKRLNPSVVSWVYHFDGLTDGAQVNVTCDTPRCVNPYHLRKTAGKKAHPTIRGFSQNRGDMPHGAEKVRVGNQMIPKFYLSHEWRQLRQDVVKRDQGLCQYCGNKGTQADHIIPRYGGGLDVLQNLVCVCATCNKLVGGRVFKTFDDKKKWILSKRD
jgi:hypothetical protein